MFKVLFLISAFSISAMAAPAQKAATAHRKPAAAEAVKCAEAGGDAMDQDYVLKQAEAAKTCYEAANAVENCGFGSSLDNATTDAAIAVCDKEIGKLKSSDVALKKMMNARCEKTCNPRNDGTLCQSRQAFCRLAVSKFLNSVNQAE